MKITGLNRWLALLFLFLLAVAPAAFAAPLHTRAQELFAAREKLANPADYTFVVMGDSRGNDAMFRKALARAATYKPLFILHGGDLSENGSAAELDHVLEMIAAEAPNLPLFVAPGNHERNRQLFAEKIGPRNFTIDSKRLNCLVIVLDNADYALKEPVLAFLRQRLQSKRSATFVAMHAPPRVGNWEWHTFSDGVDQLVSLIRQWQPSMLFFSHVHLYARDNIAGVPAIISGGAGAPLVSRDRFPGEPVHHLIVVRVRQGKVTAERVLLE